MENESSRETEPGCQLRSSTNLFSLLDFVDSSKHNLLPIPSYPNHSQPDQVLAVADAVLAAASGCRLPVKGLDCCFIIRTLPGPELIARLKNLMLLLDPVKNKLVFSGEALKVVSDAWSVLSDLVKKTQDEKDTSFLKNEQTNKKKNEEEPVSVCTVNEQKKRTLFDEKESGNDNMFKNNEKLQSQEERFCTVCPYCYYMYEYEKSYEECCLRCQNCRRAFHGVAVVEPNRNGILVEGRDEYYCGLGFFPLQYSCDSANAGTAREIKNRGGDGTCKSYSVDGVIEISDSDDDDGKKVDVRVDKAKEKVVKGNVRSNEKKNLDVRQGSGKTEETNGGKRRVRFKSAAKKSKMRERVVKGRRIKSMNEPEAKGLDLNVKFGEGNGVDHGHEMEIGSGSGSGDGNGCLDTDLEFFEKDGDVFVGFKFGE